MTIRKFFVFLVAAIVLICMSQSSVTKTSAQSDDVAQAKASIDQMLTRFRNAAENADAKEYFGCLDKDGIFLGTDEKERFTLETLKATFEPYFVKGIGWKRDIKQRYIFVGPSNQIGWFEEHAQRENLGAMRTTGVVRKTDDGWKIVQYNVSFPVPNEVVSDVAAIIRKSKESAGTNTSAASKEKLLTDEQRQRFDESFEYVWEKIRDTYWDPELGGVDWQAVYDELKPKLDNAKTEIDADRVLDGLVSRMKVSHFAIIPKAAYEELGHSEEKGARGGVTGMDLRIVDGQVLVVSVTPDSPADKAGIHTGWILEAIDEIQVPAKLAEVKKEFENNPHQRVILASAANSRIRGRVGDDITVTFRDGNDKLQEKMIELVPAPGEVVQFGHLPEFRVRVDVKSFDDDIAYFRFNAFMNPIQVMTAYNQFMTDNMDATGIIIDVRGNGGGGGEIAMGMIGWLMQGEKASFGKVILRDNELNLVVRPRAVTNSQPVVVLIDEMSVSAAEFFASGIKDLTKARLIGTRTAGAVLGSQIERLPTGDGFQFAAANFISNRTGKTLEGVGVTPHEVVEPNREMLLAGKDAAIEAAIEWIHSQNK